VKRRSPKGNYKKKGYQAAAVARVYGNLDPGAPLPPLSLKPGLHTQINGKLNLGV